MSASGHFDRRAAVWGLVAIALLCAGCAGTFAASPDQNPRVTLSKTSSGEWSVAFTSREPIDQIRFARNPDDSRATRWRVEQGFEIVHDAGVDLLRRRDRTPFERASIWVRPRYVVLPKDYAPFSPFTDGGMLIHSGQFHACAGSVECPDAARWRVTVNPPDGTHVVVGGRVRDRASFVDVFNGTNIYVGEATPLSSEHFIAVVDIGLPQEVRAALDDLLPPLMQYFASRLGPLERKPMLFASLDPDPPSGSAFSSQGGTLPDQIFIHLYGEDWASKSAQQREGFLPWFFAHEAGHLFQRSGLDHVGYAVEESWLHEGGADAFAALTIVPLGGVSTEYVQTRIDQAFGACVAGLKALGDKPLNASSATGAFRNYYTCGLLMHLAIDAAVKRASDGKRDLLDVWATFRARVRAGEPWNQDTFLDEARKQGAADAADFAHALASLPQPDPESFLRQSLGKVGMTVGVIASKPPAG